MSDESDSERSEDEEGSEEEEEGNNNEISTQHLVESDESDEAPEPENAPKVVKRKRGASQKKTSTSSPKKPKKDGESSSSVLEEKEHAEVKEGGGKTTKKSKTQAPGKREQNLFNDKNCDIDLFEHDPDKIIAKKIRINSNLVMSCKNMIINTPNGTTYDYPTVTFAKKMKDGRSYDFNINLSASPQIIKGLQKVIESNPNFFGKNNLSEIKI